jgi:putative DNA methylase
MSHAVQPFALKDAPSLIERLLPVQKLSAEAFKEQMANQGKTLTALGSYWKGRKPLILNKACILGCLLPATHNPRRDLEIFEKLMAMDDESFVARWPRRPKPVEILATLSIARIDDYFVSDPPMLLPASAPVDWSKPELKGVKVAWRKDISEADRRHLEAQMLPRLPYRQRVDAAKRPEEVMEIVHDHVWDAVNDHLGTSATSFPELIEQLGILRFGHRPRIGDTFCGSGTTLIAAEQLGRKCYGMEISPQYCDVIVKRWETLTGKKASRANE